MDPSQKKAEGKEKFINDSKYKNSNETIRTLIDNLLKTFEEKCTREFYPKWRGNEGDTKVFIFKLFRKLTSKYNSLRENIITVRVRVELFRY